MGKIIGFPFLMLFVLIYCILQAPYSFYLEQKKKKRDYEKFGVKVPIELWALAAAEVIQLKHPVSGHYVKFYRSRGYFLKTKSSSGPYNRIPIIQ